LNDRRAAEAAGLNPETAAYTKSKPRVRDYMIEHRAAVCERLVDQNCHLACPGVPWDQRVMGSRPTQADEKRPLRQVLYEPGSFA
jgi:hypothetical protein